MKVTRRFSPWWSDSIWLHHWLSRVVIYIAATVFSTALVAQSPAIGQPPSEYAVKAAFLYNIARFVEWPASAFDDPTTPIHLCVLGDDPFGKLLDETVQGKMIGQHPFTIQRLERVENAGHCHMLFISRSETAHLDEVLAAVRDKSVMTVGDMEHAARRGAIMNFVLEAGRVRFAINADMAKRSGLNLSSKLVQLATLVTPKNRPAP